MAVDFRGAAGVSLRASEWEKEWMGGYTPEPILSVRHLTTWNDEISILTEALEETDSCQGAGEELSEKVEQARKKAEDSFGRTDEEGRLYQLHVARYYAEKFRKRSRELKLSMDEYLVRFSREQISDRIIEVHFDGFQEFLAEQVFALSGARKTEENAEALALLNTARDRYELHVRCHQLSDRIWEEKEELGKIPDYTLCLTARKEIDRIRAVLDGEQVPEERLEMLNRTSAELQVFFNQKHEAAEAAAGPVLERIRELEKELSEIREVLNMEMPLVNPACAVEIWRLQAEERYGEIRAEIEGYARETSPDEEQLREWEDRLGKWLSMIRQDQDTERSDREFRRWQDASEKHRKAKTASDRREKERREQEERGALPVVPADKDLEPPGGEEYRTS